jgi:aldose sugar dehydrogenase
MLFFALCIVISLSLISGAINYSSLYAYAAYTRAIPSEGGPSLKDPSLKVEKIFQGDLGVTTSMAFLAPNDILLLEKSEGNVLRIKDGVLMPKPLLIVSNVGKEIEWGMLGIAVDKTEGDNADTNADGIPNGSHTYVFLYYTEPDSSSSTIDSSSSLATLSNTPDSDEDASDSSSSGGEDIGDDSNNNQATEPETVGIQMSNRLYRYELVNDQLVNPKLLLSLPANSPTSGTENNHDGGKVVVGPDHNVYVAIGDVGGHRGQAQNVQDGQPLDGTSGILRVTENGDPVTGSPSLATSSSDDSSSSSLASYYYAYGVRNSFGIDFDPMTGNLWESENGADDNDEINLVLPGFNSGWSKIMGIAPSNFNPANELVNFDGNGKYRDPEFVSKQTIGPTALKFLHSNKLGDQYQDTIFMGDVNTGNLYNFKLNQGRTGLMLTGPLADKTADVLEELDSVIFGQGFGVITDIKDNPYDGFLYILGYDGSIYRITSNDVM